MALQGATLQATISGFGNLVGKMAKPVGYVDYTGEYEITPTVAGQSLKTKDKHLTDDVTIKAIPYFDVGNNSGGSTVYIGSEVEQNGSF